jgi:nucleotide-binding universal stress UspA family protein
MSTALLEQSPPAIADLSTGVDALSRSHDPPIRGPILLASAGRGATNASFYIAGALAKRAGVGVEVAGVLEPYPTLLFGENPPMYPPDFEVIQRNVIERSIERRLYALGPEAERWPITVYYGNPARLISNAARDRDATMIVVGLGKHGGLNRFPGGERALQILRSADRPVFAVAPGAIALPETAVVGMDFSAASVRAARAALLSLADGGLLVLVHVRPFVDLLPLYATSEHSRESYETLMRSYRMRSDRQTAAEFTRLRDELRPYVPDGVTIETQARSGTVAEELLTVANEVNAQLVAVGTHGPGAIERFFLGSVATEVLRHAARSVLVAPEPPAAEAARLALRIRGTAEIVDPLSWPAVLDKFSARNTGRTAKLEVDDPELGAQMQLSGFALLGVSYDQHDERVEIMFGDGAVKTPHLTRSIARVDEISIAAPDGGPERALRILSGRGQTLLTFLDGEAR